MEISLENLNMDYWFAKGVNGHPYRVAGLEIKEILTSPFGDQLEKYSYQMQIFRDCVSFVGYRSMYRPMSWSTVNQHIGRHVDRESTASIGRVLTECLSRGSQFISQVVLSCRSSIGRQIDHSRLR